MMNKNFVLIIILVIGFVCWKQYNHANNKIKIKEVEFQKKKKKEEEEREIKYRENDEITKIVESFFKRIRTLTNVWSFSNSLPSLRELIISYPDDDWFEKQKQNYVSSIEGLRLLQEEAKLLKSNILSKSLYDDCTRYIQEGEEKLKSLLELESEFYKMKRPYVSELITKAIKKKQLEIKLNEEQSKEYEKQKDSITDEIRSEKDKSDGTCGEKEKILREQLKDISEKIKKLSSENFYLVRDLYYLHEWK